MLRALLVFSILVPGVLSALTNRFRALLLYLWFAFFRPQEWLWFDIAAYRPSLLLALLLLVPSFLTGIFPNVTHPLSVGFILFLFSALVAQLSAVDPATGWFWIEFFARLSLVLLVGVTLIRTPRDLMRTMAVVACSLGFFATKAGLFSMISGGARFADGLSGAFVDNNGYALATVMIMPMLLVIGQNTEVTFEGLVPQAAYRWIRLGFYTTVPLCALTVVSTFSRSGFLGMMAALVTYAVLHPKRVRIMATLALLGLLALVAAPFLPLASGYADRLATMSTVDVEAGEGESSALGRVYFWIAASRMVVDYPFGVGMRNFQPHFDAYDITDGRFGNRRDVHSSHFEVLAEEGFFGAAIWIAEFVFAFVVGRRVAKRARTPGLSPPIRTFLETVPRALMVSMVGFLVAGAFLSAALNDLTWLTFALLAALDRMSLKLSLEVSKPGQSETAVPVSRFEARPIVVRPTPVK